MRIPVTRSVLALITVAALASAQQNVALSEVHVTDQWIELANLSGVNQDISSWTVYLATKTPGMPQNYFFGFPPGTVMAPSSFLRVRWLQPIPATPEPGSVFTGNTIFHFLFGLGAEPLQQISAVGLFRTQANNQMNTPSLIEDWVSWGDGNLRREDLAAQNGRWTLGRFLEAPLSNESLARATSAIGTVSTKDLEWFHDQSPTPLESNTTAMGSNATPPACLAPGNHLLGPPNLTLASYPVCGNREFGYRIANTSGVLGEFVILVFSAGLGNQAPLLPPTSGPPCPEYLNYALFMGALLVGATPGVTTLPHNFANLPISFRGTAYFIQAVVLDGFTSVPPYQGVSNALQISIGG